MNIRRAASCIAAVLLATTAQAVAANPTAPDLSWTAGGSSVDLHDMRGRYVVLNFFATWCDACRWEEQAFVNASHGYAQRATFVGIDVGAESVEAVTKYAEQNGVDYPLVVDSEGILNGEYHISALPTTVIVDPNGQMIKRVVGGLSYGDLSTLLDGALNG